MSVRNLVPINPGVLIEHTHKVSMEMDAFRLIKVAKKP